jgi:hypothetical protein
VSFLLVSLLTGVNNRNLEKRAAENRGEDLGRGGEESGNVVVG